MRSKGMIHFAVNTSSHEGKITLRPVRAWQRSHSKTTGPLEKREPHLYTQNTFSDWFCE